MADTMLYLGKKVEVIRNAMIGDDQFNPNAPSLLIRDPETGAQFSVAKTSLVPVPPEAAPVPVAPTMPRRDNDGMVRETFAPAPALGPSTMDAVITGARVTGTIKQGAADQKAPQQPTTPPKPTTPQATVAAQRK